MPEVNRLKTEEEPEGFSGHFSPLFLEAARSFSPEGHL
jgi:hypothetical protein